MGLSYFIDYTPRPTLKLLERYNRNQLKIVIKLSKHKLRIKRYLKIHKSSPDTRFFLKQPTWKIYFNFWSRTAFLKAINYPNILKLK